MCSTREQRERIYGSSAFLRETTINAEPWRKPVLHQVDSQVFQFVIAWVFGKFIPCAVPKNWTSIPFAAEDNASEDTDDIFDCYMGVSFLTVGNVLINPRKRKCGLIKDIIHDNWDPSPLPFPGESLLEWHLRLVSVSKIAQGKKKEGNENYLKFKPVTTVVLDEILLDWNNFNITNMHGDYIMKTSKLTPELSELLLCVDQSLALCNVLTKSYQCFTCVDCGLGKDLSKYSGNLTVTILIGWQPD